MTRICIIALSISIITLTAAAPVKAFWLDPPEPEPFTMHGARETAPSSDKKGLFTVQDNFNLFTREDGNTPILLPHSDYFVAADTINANLPIFGLFTHPAQASDDPITNLIYADLKLKKLIDQYAELQEKAKKLLNSQYSTNTDGAMETAGLPDISKKLRQLSNNLSMINTEKIDINSKTAASTDSPKSSKTIITLHQLKTRTKHQQQIAKLAISRVPKINQPNAIGIRGQTNTNHSASPTASTPSNLNHSFVGSEEITINYFIKIPFKIFGYILTHKFESLFIGFFILMFTSIIFGSRS